MIDAVIAASCVWFAFDTQARKRGGSMLTWVEKPTRQPDRRAVTMTIGGSTCDSSSWNASAPEVPEEDIPVFLDHRRQCETHEVPAERIAHDPPGVAPGDRRD